MFDAELWPRKRPPVRSRIAKPAQAGALFQEQEHTDLELSLTAKKGNSGFKKGIPEKIVRKPIALPRWVTPVIQGTHAIPPAEHPEQADPIEAASEHTLETMEPAATEHPVAEPLSDETLSAEPSATESPGEALAGHAEDQERQEPQEPQEAEAGAPAQDLARHLLDDAAVEAIRQEAYALGKADGAAQADAVGFARGLEEGRLQGIEEGKALGRAEAQEEMREPIAALEQEVKGIVDKLNAAARDTAGFHEPLKRLAMHLAEQLVRGELQASPAAVARLIDRALMEFGQETISPSVIFLNSVDLKHLKESGFGMPTTVDLRADDTLLPGSVRVSMNGAVIEDLIQTRHRALWRALVENEQAEPPPSFLANVEAVKGAMDDILDDSEVIDAAQ